MGADRVPSAQPRRSGAGLNSRTPAARVAGVVNIGLGLVFTAVVLVLFVSPRDSEFLDHPRLGCVLTLLALGIGVAVARRWPRPWEMTGRRSILLAALLASASSVVAYFSRFDSAWDPRIVQSASHQLAVTGHLNRGELNYFSRYPNNLPLALLDAPLTAIARTLSVSFFDVMVVWNGLLFFGILVLTSSTLGRLSRPSWTIAAFALLTLLLGFSTHMDVAYTDVPGCLLAAALINLGVRLATERDHPYRLMCMAAAVSGVSYLLKPYVLVIPVAGLVMFALSGGFMRLRRRWGGRGMAARLLVVPVIAFGASSVEKDLAYRNAHVTPTALAHRNAPLPMLHWVAMGLHDSGSLRRTRTYGGYDADIVRRDAQIKDPERRDRVIRDGIEHDLRRQGFSGTLGFLGKKIAWVLGDGTFYAQGEGHDRFASARAPGPISAVTLRTGAAYHVKAGLVQAVWGAMLIALAFGVVRRRHDVRIGWMSLALHGFILYEAFFEGRPRYVVAVLPVFIVLLALSYPTRTAVTTNDQT